MPRSNLFIFVLLLVFLLVGTCVQAEPVDIHWTPPTTNEDGTPLTDLDKYTVYWGNVSGTYDSHADISKDDVIHTLSLTVGHWCIAMTASDTSGNESIKSNELCKDVVDIMSPSSFMINFFE